MYALTKVDIQTRHVRVVRNTAASVNQLNELHGFLLQYLWLLYASLLYVRLKMKGKEDNLEEDILIFDVIG